MQRPHRAVPARTDPEPGSRSWPGTAPYRGRRRSRISMSARSLVRPVARLLSSSAVLPRNGTSSGAHQRGQQIEKIGVQRLGSVDGGGDGVRMTRPGIRSLVYPGRRRPADVQASMASRHIMPIRSSGVVRSLKSSPGSSPRRNTLTGHEPRAARRSAAAARLGDITHDHMSSIAAPDATHPRESLVSRHRADSGSAPPESGAGHGIGSSSANRRRTFSVIRDTSLS